MLAEMVTPAQKIAVSLAFTAAGLSFASAGARLLSGDLAVTPLAGGLLMLALAIGGLVKLRPRTPAREHPAEIERTPKGMQ